MRRPRRRSLVLAALVLLSVVTIATGLWLRLERRSEIARQSQPAAAGSTAPVAPDFTLRNLQGEAVSLSDLRGKVVLLNFWATWCPPCEAEMPDLNALYEGYGESKDFVVLAVNQKEGKPLVDAFVTERGLTFPVLLDPDGLAQKRFNVRALPMSLIIDRDGNIRDSWNGQIAREAMLSRLERVW